MRGGREWRGERERGERERERERQRETERESTFIVNRASLNLSIAFLHKMSACGRNSGTLYVKVYV